jgi:Sensors of blue-light using FAD
MENIIQVIYVSAAAPDISKHDTAEFLKEARKTNRKNDVSGMMLYVGGCLLMLLEGEAHNVGVASLEIVARKREMREIFREPVAEREFPDWILGFDAVAPVEAARLLEPLMFNSTSHPVHIEPQSARTLLSIIGRRRWQSDRSGMFRAIRRTDGTGPRT